ncbi:hypothetical protein SAMN05661093_10701 [Kibdelosporangium aridum]|uniref:Uncharacterized protein n=2 Tax=Kibdelosporangium aridum TaxID=2030 RepID=A0A1Y5Y8A8_KIBAR|nr:hypothetical protein SAMN05661093_10701 [Kibdelosporangium aridum]
MESLPRKVCRCDAPGDAITWSAAFNSKYIDNSGGLANTPVQVNGNRLTVTAPDRLGVWKVYVMAEDGHGNIGIKTKSVRVVAPQPAGVNVALGKPSTASSYQQIGDGAPLCEEIDATWVGPQNLLTQDVDVLVPAALGGWPAVHRSATVLCAVEKRHADQICTQQRLIEQIQADTVRR